MTVFNRQNVIIRALASIASQTYSNFEVIVVDDASSDSSVIKVQEFAAQSGLEISLLRHEFNMGQNAAINTALEHCRGEFVAFLDSDDIWLPNFLESFDNHISSLSSDIFGFHYCRLVGGPAWILEGSNKFADALRQGYVSALGTLVVRLKCILEIAPLPERMFLNDMCQDDYLSLELARRFSFSHLPQELYQIIGDDSSRISSLNENFILGWAQFFDFYRSEIIRELGFGVYSSQLARVGFEILRSHKFQLFYRYSSKVLVNVPIPHRGFYFGKLVITIVSRVRNKLIRIGKRLIRRADI
jgi:glycosyltransferase involved in cell wall biosynthesis